MDLKPIDGDIAFIARVEEARQERGLSQMELGRRMSAAGHAWHQTTVAKTELGERRLLLSEALTLGALLDVPLPTVRIDEARQAKVDQLVRIIAEAREIIFDL